MLTWAPTTESPCGPNTSRYSEFQPHLHAEEEALKEVEELKRYGVKLENSHKYGYVWRPPPQGSRRDPEPWQKSVVGQMGSSKPLQCASFEDWNNEEFLLDISNGIAYCTLNRPAANNAINAGISAGLHDAGLILQKRTDVRLVVLTGNGRMFCAGGDPKMFQQAQADAGTVFRSTVGEAGHEGAEPLDEGALMENPTGREISGFASAFSPHDDFSQGLERDLLEWASLPQFTLCCMNGSAMGGGVGLVCACDMAVAVKTAHVVLSEVKLGIIPAAVAPLVIRTVGGHNAKRLFVSAENCGMELAKKMGIIQRTVVEIAEFPVVVKEVATKIQALAPGAVAATKRSLIDSSDTMVSESLMGSFASAYARVRKTKECEEGMKALASKKRPEWMETKIAVKE